MRDSTFVDAASARPERGRSLRPRMSGTASGALAPAVEQLGALIAWYDGARARGPERHARRVLIAGVRLVALRLVGSLVGRDPCRTFRVTTNLAERLYARARRQYLTTDARPCLGARGREYARMPEVRRIAKSGHSKVIALPRRYLLALGFRLGDIVMIEHVGATLVLSRAVPQRALFEKDAIEPVKVDE